MNISGIKFRKTKVDDLELLFKFQLDKEAINLAATDSAYSASSRSLRN